LLRFSLANLPTTLNKTLTVDFTIDSGFASGVSLEVDGVPLLLAYSKSPEFDTSLSQFKSLVYNRALTQRKQTEAENKTNNKLKNVDDDSLSLSNLEDNSLNAQSPYDDEAVATENYYELEQDISKNVQVEIIDDGVRTENGVLDCNGKEETGQSEEIYSFDEITAESNSGQKYNEQNPYYFTAKKELDCLFLRFPKVSELMKMFLDSTFVKINYSKDKHYVVGLINEQKKPKYICYGIPSLYCEKAPKELEGYCSFIPLSVFDLKGDGYFMMFQDAVTGECVKKLTRL
jgi:hypothetical protein